MTERWPVSSRPILQSQRVAFLSWPTLCVAELPDVHPLRLLLGSVSDGAACQARRPRGVAVSGDGGCLYNTQGMTRAVQYGIGAIAHDNAYGNVVRGVQEGRVGIPWRSR